MRLQLRPRKKIWIGKFLQVVVHVIVITFPHNPLLSNYNVLYRKACSNVSSSEIPYAKFSQKKQKITKLLSHGSAKGNLFL
jgi:hypothetical protein